MTMPPSAARELAEKTLSEKRFYHTECVAKAAVILAGRYGCDEKSAETAAYLHDILKERSLDDLLQIAGRSDIISSELLEHGAKTLHAFAGGDYVERELNQPGEIADAVRYHTTGRRDMTPLDKIVYLADYISDDRAFGGVDEVRELAKRSLDAACFKAAKNGLLHLVKNGRYIESHSLDAYNYFAELLKGTENV